jgi:bilirubin oxidase
MKMDSNKSGGMGMMGGGMGGGMMMSMAHPIHLHGQQYQIISRKMEGMRKEEYATVKDGFIDSGWKDTVLVMPGEEIEIIKPFQHYKGFFLYHCHNLEHEDLGMMRQFYVY